jgi:tripartite-type tricarboxylate transporter receptor subunit TctC
VIIKNTFTSRASPAVTQRDVATTSILPTASARAAAIAIATISTLALVCSTSASFAQNAWPSKPIRYVVPFAAGGTTDQLARLLQPKLQEALGVAIVIDNRPGAGGNTGSDVVAKATPDGYTIGGGTVSSHAINVSLYGEKMPYDPIKNFEPIALLATLPNVLVVHPSVPAKTTAELVAWLKSGSADAKKATFASAGNGTSQHLSGELFKALAGVEMQHIPYKGSAPGITAALSGEVTMMFDNALIAIPHVKAGKLRALGVTTKNASSALPDVPPLSRDLPGYDVTSWQAVYAPAGTPKDIVERLHREVMKILALPETREKLTLLGADAGTLTREEFLAFNRAEIAKFADVVKKSGARID